MSSSKQSLYSPRYNIPQSNYSNHTYSMNSFQMNDTCNDRNISSFDYYNQEPKEGDSDLDYKISQLKLENEQLINEMNEKRRDNAIKNIVINHTPPSNKMTQVQRSCSGSKKGNEETYVQIMLRENEELKTTVEKYREMLSECFRFFNIIEKNFQKEEIDFAYFYDHIDEFKIKLKETQELIKDLPKQLYQSPCNTNLHLKASNTPEISDDSNSNSRRNSQYCCDKNHYDKKYCFKRIQRIDDYNSEDQHDLYDNYNSNKSNKEPLRINCQSQVVNKKKYDLSLPSFGNKASKDSMNNNPLRNNQDYSNDDIFIDLSNQEHQDKPKKSCAACLMNNNTSSKGYKPITCFPKSRSRLFRSRSITPKKDNNIIPIY